LKFPELIFTALTVREVLDDLYEDRTLLVTDPFNYETVSSFGRTIEVKNIFHQICHDEIGDFVYDRVIAVGGCSALDAGRYLARDFLFIGIPTILSTSCISVNSSILRSEEDRYSLKTIIPDSTIIPFGTILSTERAALARYSSSGLGDLLANISASIDYETKRGNSSFESLKADAREAFRALDWFNDFFEGYNKDSLKRLALHLHNSSVEVIRRGNSDLSAGIEHDFYEVIVRQQKYSNIIQTHGFLVALGTLVTAAIYEELHGNQNLLGRLENLFRKTGIPRIRKDLEDLGIMREHIYMALEALKDRESIVTHYFRDRGYSLIDRIFC
jgi:glycerol dehydrogenase-like iron-containing ADH family enzyme